MREHSLEDERVREHNNGHAHGYELGCGHEWAIQVGEGVGVGVGLNLGAWASA